VLLLICCVNLAGLQTARNDTRRREFGIRMSLGAGAGRLTRQLLTESLVLAMLGGGAGVGLSLLLNNYLQSSFYSMDYAGRPLHYDFTPDFRVLIAVLAVSTAAGLLMGTWPARKAAHESLRARSTGTGRATPAGRYLVGAQAGFAVALAAVAGLLIASAQGILGGHNFEPSHVALIRLRPRLIQYTPAEAQQYIRKVLRQLQDSPEVESASLVGNGVALLGGTGTVSLPGASAGREAEIGRIQIGPRYFETMRTSILQGREFAPGDDTGAPLVAIVNEALVRRLWKESPAIGATLLVNRQPHQVIGIVANVELQSRDESAEPYVYTAFWQDATAVDARLCIRVKGDPAAMVAALARSVNRVAPDVPVTETIPLSRQLDGTTRALQLTAAFVSYAAILAIGLSIVGLYGALASAVQRRRKEMGIRLAVGANPTELLAMVVKEGMSVIVAGVMFGVAMAIAATQVLRHLLYGSGSSDMTIYLAASLVVLVASLIACSIPAYRAASVEPLSALREE
jgi:predicted permease